MATKKVTQAPVRIDEHETFVSIRKAFTESGDIQEKLKALYDLQQIDSELDGIYQLRGELPVEVEALENKIAELGGKAANIAQEITDCEKKIGELKQQEIVCNDQIEKYKARLEGVENSREYDSLSKEVENQDLLAQVARKRIGEAEEEIVAKNEDLKIVNDKIAVRKEDLVAKKQELETIAASTAKQEEKLLARRATSAATIDARTMSAYERIRKSVKNHIAVAAVYNENACGGCHSAIAPQRLIDIKGGKKMVICEYCGRILVCPETPKEENAA